MKRSRLLALTTAALLVAGLSACNRDPVKPTTSPSATNSTPQAGTMTPTPPGGPVAQVEPTDPKRSVGETVDDATITMKVKTALIADPTVKATDVNVDTSRGVVKLTGVVADQTQVDRAAQIARSVGGVLNVDNNLRVGAS